MILKLEKTFLICHFIQGHALVTIRNRILLKAKDKLNHINIKPNTDCVYSQGKTNKNTWMRCKFKKLFII